MNKLWLGQGGIAIPLSLQNRQHEEEEMQGAEFVVFLIMDLRQSVLNTVFWQQYGGKFNKETKYKTGRRRRNFPCKTLAMNHL